MVVSEPDPSQPFAMDDTLYVVCIVHALAKGLVPRLCQWWSSMNLWNERIRITTRTEPCIVGRRSWKFTKQNAWNL